MAEPLIVTRTTPAITRLDAPVRAGIAALPATREEHARQFAGYPALHEIELGAPPAPAQLQGPARILFWNAERGKFLDPAARLLGRLDAAAILLCELDLGMARSGQAHTARELAGRLGLGYVFGVEFLELGLGDAFEQSWHAGQTNEAGLHGAAILSRSPLERPALIRLEQDGNWFDGAHGERRVGGRMAMVATLRIGGRPVTLACVHFESHSDPDARALQLRRLLDALDRYGGDQPVVIGGDLNTSTTRARLGARLGQEARAARATPARPGGLRAALRGRTGGGLRLARLQRARRSDPAHPPGRHAGTAARQDRLVLRPRPRARGCADHPRRR